LVPYFRKTKESRVRRNIDKFFITIKPDSHGSVSGLISKRFAYALNKVTSDKSYRLHSFRHTFTTKAHALNMFTDANVKKVTGHKTGEVHHDIYQHQDLHITKEIIEATYGKLINDDEISRIIDKLK
jgi:integrase